MKKILSLVMAFISCFSFVSCNKTVKVENMEEKALNAVVGYTSNKEFMIKGWVMPSANSYESYRLVKELGVTHVMIDGNTGLKFGDEKFEAVMGYMNELGVNGIYTIGNFGRDEELDYGLDKDFTKYSAIKGVNYFDEPYEREMNSHIYDMLVEHEKKYDDKLFFYSNLLPYHAFGKDYNAHVENYCEDVLSKVNGRRILSMDVYPYYYGDKLIESTWLAGLETISKNARKYNCEMMIWVQTIENLSLGDGSLRQPLKEEFAHQVYSALAFGAKGFGYFTLGSGLAPGWGEALITRYDEASESYYWAKELNENVCSFQDVYLSFNHEKTLAVDGDEAENQCLNFLYMDKRPTLDKVNDISAKEDALIGQFDNGGQKAYMITNFAEPMLGKKNVVKMTFENANAVVVYANGQRKVYRLIDGKAVFNLGIGEGVFAIPVNV